MNEVMNSKSAPNVKWEAFQPGAFCVAKMDGSGLCLGLNVAW